MNKNTLIDVKNVTKSFTLPSEEVRALRECNFAIPENSFTIIYGPSGSGKSTLLNALVGLDRPSSGTVHYRNYDIYTLSSDERANFRARRLGMVYQTNYWVNSMSVLDNVSMPLYLAGQTARQARKKSLETLRVLGIESLAHKRPTLLSGGEQQRVSIARSLVAEPELIVADEPTGNLDTKNGDIVMNLLANLHQNGNKTIILVTHNLEYLPLSTHRVRIIDGVAQQEDGVYQSSDTDIKRRLEDFQDRLRTKKPVDSVKRGGQQ